MVSDNRELITNMAQDILIGLDVGTSTAKGGAFTAGGHLIKFASRSYPMSSSPGIENSAEADPSRWWEAVVGVVKELTGVIPPHRVAAISVGSQGPSLVALDKDGSPLISILWMDRRADEEAAILSQSVGRRIDASFFFPKAYWIKRNRPDVYRKTRWFVGCLDYISYRLTGKASLALFSSAPIFSAWEEDLVQASGFDSSKFPPSLRMGSQIGPLTSEAAMATGLPQGTPVIAGCPDFVESLLGTGTVSKGLLCDRGGTSQGLNLCWDGEVKDSRLFSVPHPIRSGYWNLSGLMSTTGKSLEWYRDNFYGKDTLYEAILSEAHKSPPGARGLIFLPYLHGERSPIWDDDARGVFFGLSLQHTRADLARSIIEGVAYGMGQIIRIMVGLGTSPLQIRVSGSQGRSDMWNQIKADVTGLEVYVPEVLDSEVLGAAIIAGCGAGLYPDMVQASERAVKIRKVFKPDSERGVMYRKLMGVYEGLYPALRGEFSELAKIKAELGRQPL
jgi:xylulokinase